MRPARFFRALLAACILAALAPSAAFAEPVFIGTTFSHRQTAYLEMDWKETYLELLKLNFYVIRLGAYWDEIEPKEDRYDFSTLDWQIAEAKKRNIPVVLTVGMKAPRWPEFFFPKWVEPHVTAPIGGDVAQSRFLREKTLRFVETVVRRYRDEPAVKYWQVENEALDRSGAKYWWINREFLGEEVALVRKLDGGKRPIILTAATYPNKVLLFLARFRLDPHPIRASLPLCDILGVNIYPAIGMRFWKFKLYFWTTVAERTQYFQKLLALVNRYRKKAWIMELQAEPWEPDMLVHTTKERVPTGWPEAVRGSFQEFRDAGFGAIFLWGAEYWHYRNTRQDDPHWWDLALELLTPN